MTTPRRRWSRFSLRTLFVMVTAACCWLGWLGWNWQIVRERQSVRQEIEQAGATFNVMTSPTTFFINLERNPMPFPRNWLGDSREAGIDVPSHFSDGDIARVRTAFPEGWVHRAGK